MLPAHEEILSIQLVTNNKYARQVRSCAAGLKEQCHLVLIFSAHNNKISEIVRCLKYSLVVLYGKLYGTKLCMFLHIICESASRIRHIGLENLKNYCRSFSSSRAQKRCAPGDTAPLTRTYYYYYYFHIF